MKTRAFVFAALFVTMPASFAQEDKKKPSGTEQKMPDPKHKEHDALKPMTGDWECVTKIEAMPGVPGMEKPMESKGTEHAELVCNGLWLKSVVTGTCNGEPFQGVWLAGYDPFKKKYAGVFVSSDEHDGAFVCDGIYDEKTKNWAWSGKTPHGELRTTFVFKDADNTVETCYLRTPEGKEVKCMEATRKRTRSAAAVDASAKAAKGLSKEQESLHAMAGDWAATVKSSHMPGEAPTEEKATERATVVCGGRWIWSDFSCQFHGAPFEGHGIWGYDTNEKKYVSFWIDSMSPICAKTSGDFDAAKKTWSLAGTCMDVTGKPMTLKQVITVQDADTRVEQMEFKSPEMKASTMEITYKRTSK